MLPTLPSKLAGHNPNVAIFQSLWRAGHFVNGFVHRHGEFPLRKHFIPFKPPVRFRNKLVRKESADTGFQNELAKSYLQMGDLA